MNSYTVERYFRGWNAKYNDVPMWDYGALFKAFAPEVKDIRTFRVSTAGELDKLLGDGEFNSATYPQVSLYLLWLDLGCANYVMNSVSICSWIGRMRLLL